MKKNLAIFVNDDFFSKYSYEKLKKDYNLFPFSLKKSKNFDSFVLNDANLNLLLDFFKKNKIELVFFVGKVNQNILFGNLHISIKNLLEEIENFKPEEIMKKIANFLENNGFEILKQDEVFKEEIAEEKIYTYPLTEEEKKDVKFGFSVLMDIIKHNIGQSLIVKNGMILGVEGIEGTDEFIKRIGKYCTEFVFIKGCSDEKDIRFDLPVIGIKTIKNLIEAKGKVIAIKAGKTIILNKEKVIEECFKNRIKLTGIR